MTKLLIAVLLVLALICAVDYAHGQSVVTSSVSCYTDASGNVVGVPDALVVPVLSANYASGSLSAGTYYVKIAYYNSTGIGIASPEASITLSGTGKIIVTAPVLQPASATGYKVYVSTTTGTETLQGTSSAWSNYTQSAALVAGAALPSSNGSACSVYFSDELIPTGTGYSVNLRNRAGSQIAGFPQTWCTFGGTNGTINITNGAPNGLCGSNGVFYPTPILANGTTTQSILGSLIVTGDLTVQGTLTYTGLTVTGTSSLTTLAVTSLTVNGNTFSAPLASYTYTFPSATTTLVGTATTQTLTNKTITGATITGSTIGTSTLTSPTIATGIPNSAGFNTKRLTTGSVGASSSAAVALTWATAFADTNYTVNCSVVDDTNNLSVQSLSSKATTGVTVNVSNADSGSAHTGQVECIAVHDGA